MRKIGQVHILLSLAAGLALGAALMGVAWQENSQCEIHCAELGIDWAYWLTLGAAGLVMGFALCMALMVLLRLMVRMLGKR